jgi:hypothetical protein
MKDPVKERLFFPIWRETPLSQIGYSFCLSLVKLIMLLLSRMRQIHLLQASVWDWLDIFLLTKADEQDAFICQRLMCGSQDQKALLCLLLPHGAYGIMIGRRRFTPPLF